MKTTKNLFSIALSFSLCFLVMQVNGQGWERTYGTNNNDWASDFLQTDDGGFIIVGSTTDSISYKRSVYVIRLNSNSDTVWTKIYDGNIDDYGVTIQSTNDFGFIICGTTQIDSSSYRDILLMKIDQNGNLLWTKNYGGVGEDNGIAALATSDNGYLVLGIINIYINDIFLVKTNSLGDTMWTKVLPFSNLGSDGIGFIKTNDGNFIISCDAQEISSMMSADLIKIDDMGNILWTKELDNAGVSGFSTNYVVNTLDSGYIFLRSNSLPGPSYFTLWKTDQFGNILWETTYPSDSIGYVAFNIVSSVDGGCFILGGKTRDSIPFLTDAFLLKINSSGNIEWEKIFGGIMDDYSTSVLEVEGDNLVILGNSGSYSSNGLFDIFLIKTPNPLNNIEGKVYYDSNVNCIQDFGENHFKNYLLKLNSSSYYSYSISNDSGFFSFKVDSGTYTVSQITTHPYWTQTCPLGNSYTVNFATNSYDTSSNNNFGNQISIYCPLMLVDVATNIVRPCRQGEYTVNYCNNGTADANNSYIEVEFPDEIIPLSSSPVNWNSVNGNTYRFDLGTVAVGQCGTIYITDSVLCDAVMGSTLCVKANIFPDTICTPLDTNWDKSSIQVDGYCLNDSLAHFIIYNVGNNMTAPSEYRFYANNYFSKKQNFQLNAGDSLVVDVVACGKTIRLEADQRPGHPGNSHPRATVENCGTSCALPTFGFVNGVAEDDEDYFVEEDCQIVRASYDPNEKLVKPEGITANRYISAKDELEYQINFQNTGNDTAFLVVIRDTLNDNVVDIGSVVSGASSHPYTFRIYGQGILEWKFQNILLPDSNVNETQSHGFVKFKVKQANNPKGTIIKNDAGIYFDFNAPVVTDEVAVTVFDTTIISGNKELAVGSGSKQLEVEIVPNPFSENATLRITNNGKLRMEKMELTIYNLLGEKVKQSFIRNSDTFVIGRNNLPDGIYFYQITNNKESIANGKLIIQ